ncbi:MAG: MFS transporter [Patescibacteria group bacterium]
MKNSTRFYIAGFLRNLYFYLPIFTLFLLDRGITMEAVVFSQTFYSLMQFIAEVPTGLFADRYSQKTSIVIGYFIEALGIAAVLLSPTTGGLYLCYALGGLSMAFLSGSEEALLYESAKRERVSYQKSYGKFLALQTWGMVAGTMLAGLATQIYGESSYVWLMIGTVVALGISALVSFFHTSYPAVIDDPTVGSGMFNMLKRSMVLIRKNDTVFNLTIAATLTLGGEYYLLSVYQPVFIESGVPTALLGVTFSVGLALSAFLVHRSDLFERYFTLDKIILFVTLAIAVGYAALGFSHNPFVVVIAFLLLRSLLEVTSPITSDYINEHVPSDIRSTTLSGISLVSRLAAVLQRILLTVAVAYGGVRLSLVSQSVYLVIGGLLAFWLFRRCGCVHRIHPRTKSVV